MKKLIGGGILTLLGLYSLTLFSSALFSIIAGILPLLLITGGISVMFMGSDKNPADEEKSGIEFSPVQPAEPATPVPSKKTAAPAKAIKTKPTTTADKPAKTEASPKNTDNQEQFRGNTSSQVFHSTSCQYANGKKCTESFASRKEATQAGYTPCKTCCGE